ncbi:MAG: polyprenol monophosphomannose synthase [Anaerolineaceae bacterium]|nr:polyprenol monophosphomannose synthase [Anaerolineaceae bacterium]
MKITMVIPTYNESENLPKLVKDVLALPLEDIHILIVDDNSPDGTGDLAEKLRKEYNDRVHCLHRAGKLGLGSAYREGFKMAMDEGADYIGQMDADFSHPVDKIPMMVKELANADLVIGSRYVKGGKLDENWPFYRKWLSGFGNAYARVILNLPNRDVTGGFKLWKKETLAAMPMDTIKSNGYVFQVEMNYVASKMGFKIVEIPIYFQERTMGKSKMNLKISLEAAWRTVALRSQHKDLVKR